MTVTTSIFYDTVYDIHDFIHNHKWQFMSSKFFYGGQHGLVSGDFTYSLFDERDTQKLYKVMLYRYYPSFNYWHPSLGYDVAILTVSEEIEFDDFRKPIPICRGEEGISNVNNHAVMLIGLGWKSRNVPSRYLRVSKYR